MGEREGAPLTARTAVSANLVGREFEFARLREALDAAMMGKGGVLFVVGEPGIGKSRLTDAIASDSARRGLPVLRGRAVQTATPAAYRPLAEALSSALRAGAAPDAATLGPFRAILGRLVPEWGFDDQESLDNSVVAVAEGVVRFLRAIASEDGALLVLEDLHWADPETVTIVEYLADNLVAERALCVVTVRDDGPSSGLELARSLHARRVSPVLALAPLDRQEVAAMVGSCLGSSTVPGEVVEFAGRADGVPFMVEELLAAALSSGALIDEGGSWRVVGSLEAVVPPTFVEHATAGGLARRPLPGGAGCRCGAGAAV